MTEETFDPDTPLTIAATEEPKSLDQRMRDAIVHADCYCKPGDPTCEDWANAEDRWNAIHKSVMDALTRRDFPGAPHGAVLEQVHRVFTVYQGDIDPWMIAAELVAFVDKHSILKYMESPESEQSNLVDHARRELGLIGVEQEVIDNIVKMIRVFNELGHSGGSAPIVTHLLNEVLQFHPLSNLTDDPDEWMHISEDIWGQPGGIWQNIRDSRMFSKDNGISYTNVEENVGDGVTPIHHSEHKEKHGPIQEPTESH